MISQLECISIYKYNIRIAAALLLLYLDKLEYGIALGSAESLIYTLTQHSSVHILAESARA